MGGARLSATLLANVFSYGASGLVALALTPFLISTVGKETYSFYPLANNLVLYVGILGIALNSMAARFVTVALVRGHHLDADKYASSILRANVLLAALLTPILIILVLNIEDALSVPAPDVREVKVLFGLVFLAMLMRIVGSIYGVAVFAANRLDLRAALEIGLTTVRVLVYFLLFYLFTPSVAYVGVVALLVEVVSLAANLALTRKLLPRLRILRSPVSFSLLKEVLVSGSWNAVSQLGAIMISSLTLLMSNLFIGPSATGSYAVALTVPTFVAGFVAMIGSIFTPATTEQFARGNLSSLLSAVARAQNISGAFSALIIGVYVAVAQDFFELWVPGEDASLLSAVSILAVVHLLFTGATWPVFNLNIAMNRVRVPALTMIAAGIATVVLALATLRFSELGIIGLALSSLLPNLALVLLFVPLYPCRRLQIPRTQFYLPVAKAVLIFSGVLVGTLILKTALDPSTWTGLFLVCVFAGAIGILLSSIVTFGPRSVLRAIVEVQKILAVRATARGRP